MQSTATAKVNETPEVDINHFITEYATQVGPEIEIFTITKQCY
jgi:uncharacterized protein YmfQ (DUF2313 family)